MSDREYVRVAQVRRPHGIRGELLVRALTDRPEALLAAGRSLFTPDEPARPRQELKVRSARATKDGWLLAVDAVPDRTAADAMRGRDLYMRRDDVPAAAAGATIVDDLLGLSMTLADGTQLGTVSDYYELPQGLVLEVTRADASVLFPFNEAFVSRIELDRGVIVVDPPPGLFD
ncbi:MAG: ribosome maturation factor RimM [Gemmatimonadaceae bacterium]